MTLDRADLAVVMVLVGGLGILVGAALLAPALAIAIAGGLLVAVGLRNLG